MSTQLMVSITLLLLPLLTSLAEVSANPEISPDLILMENPPYCGEDPEGPISEAACDREMRTSILFGRIFRLRLGEWWGIQSVGSAYSPYLGFIPQLYSFNPSFKLDLSLGFITFKDVGRDQQTLAIDILTRIRWVPKIHGMSLGVGLGTFTWINGGTTLETVFGINSPPIQLGNESFHGTLDFFLDYLTLFVPFEVSHGLRVGVTLHTP